MNAIEVEIFRHLFQSTAEEMGIVLRQSALSPNIRERLDFSCAITGPDGAMVAQAAHIPVHLGSSHLTARIILREMRLEPGDVVLLNDPFRGGTHLPDLTLFAPVFEDGRDRPIFGVLCRAHHADVGGGVPGSMGDFDELFKEGVIIPPVKIEARGRRIDDLQRFFLANVRTPRERRGDLDAQIGATKRGVRRLEEALHRYGSATLVEATEALHRRAALAVRQVIAEIPAGRHRFVDHLDGPDSPRIAVTVERRRGRLVVDFSGTSPVVPSALNAHEAITLSAVFYALRCLAPEDVPTNSGILDAIDLRLPPDSLVGARAPAAVAGGNVETSQRIVDCVFGALAKALPDRIPAASQGTMNSFSFGGKRSDGSSFTYYETIAGGIGATSGSPGAHGLHSHMTNTLNTPIEALELEYPVCMRAYHFRRKSGGAGRQKGGDGVVRECEALAALEVTLLTTRRESGPWGLAGGEAGAPGRNLHQVGDRKRKLGARVTFELAPGEVVRIETPGGGGHGRPSRGSRPL